MRAVESTDRARRAWPDADREWATRAAAEVVTGSGTDESFLRQRAVLVRARLTERYPALRRALRAWTWPAWLGAVTCVTAFVAGFLIDRVGDDGRINILAPPVLGLCAWNLVVYGVLLWRKVTAMVGRRQRRPGPVRAFLVRTATRSMTSRRLGPKLPVAQSVAAFVVDWSRLVTPLYAARAARVLHLAAAFLALGVLAGLYLRGLAFEYRASWQSTFLGPAEVQQLLRFALAPASWLTGLPLPSGEHVAALRSSTPGGGENAAPWVHLLAATVALVVIVPRLLLALLAWLFERRRERKMSVDLGDPYYRRLLRTFREGPLQVVVVPYGITMGDAAWEALRTLLSRAFGRTEMKVTNVVAYGGEDTLPTGLVPASAHLVLPVFNLTATPEAAAHGAFLEHLAPVTGARVDCVAVVDESAFRQRWPNDESRLSQRRDAWRELFVAMHVHAVFAHLASLDLERSADALEQAVEDRVT